MVADLLHVDLGAVGQPSLPGLAQDGVEGLAPGLEGMLQARHEPARQALLEQHFSHTWRLAAWDCTCRIGAASRMLSGFGLCLCLRAGKATHVQRLGLDCSSTHQVTTSAMRSAGSWVRAAWSRKRGYTQTSASFSR